MTARWSEKNYQINYLIDLCKISSKDLNDGRGTELVRKKWNESGFRPPLCTYRLNRARRTSWGWWDDWGDTVLQTQYSKFEPWRSEAEHANSRSRRPPTILTFTRGWGRNIFVSFKPPRPGTEPRTPAWKAAVVTTTLGPPPRIGQKLEFCTSSCPLICTRLVKKRIAVGILLKKAKLAKDIWIVSILHW